LNGYVSGSGGIVGKTTNGGTTWTLIETGSMQNLYVVRGTKQGTVWAVGDSGTVLHSFDGGVQWEGDFAGTQKNLYGLFLLNDSTIWVSGENGTITAPKTPITTYVPRQLSGSVPAQFELGRNFPNPFNPTTEIIFSVPDLNGEPVFLTVNDLLGRRIAILVNTFLPAGTYRTAWNAAHAASGVYLYTLQAGSFQLTKRMMLLR
jgi:hypothetical protein